MTFKLEINLGNDAMQTPGDVSDALRQIARALLECEEFGDNHVIRDDNGNRVGFFGVNN